MTGDERRYLRAEVDKRRRELIVRKHEGQVRGPCHAKNREGTLCKLVAPPGQDYCRVHEARMEAR